MTDIEFAAPVNSRQGIGVVQPESGLDYPFVAPSADIQYAVADFYFSYDDPTDYIAGAREAKLPLRLLLLTSAPDIKIVDADAHVIFDTTRQIAGEDIYSLTRDDVWGSNYKIYEWTYNAAYIDNHLAALRTDYPDLVKGVCRVVLYSDWEQPASLSPQNAVLDARAVYRLPARLLSLQTRNCDSLSPRYRGNFKFKTGFNTNIAAATQTSANFHLNTAVTFTAVAGSGGGKFRTCAEDLIIDCQPATVIPNGTPITEINGVNPSSTGDFLISASGCNWVRRPVNYIDDVAHVLAEQQIGGDCPPCCTCPEYVDTALYMNLEANKYQLIGLRASVIRAKHQENIDRWNNQRACSLMHPLTLLMEAQRCPYIDIIAILCNSCTECFSATRLHIAITKPSALSMATVAGFTAIVAPGARGKTVQLTQTAGGYSVLLPPLPVGESAYVKFRLNFEQLGLPVNSTNFRARGPQLITATLTATIVNSGAALLVNCGGLVDGLSPEPASAAAAQTLHCNDAGQTDTA